ncbi:concanavalin A-like lectin/glucanase domain-containing protein [Aspergillus unguis]
MSSSLMRKVGSLAASAIIFPSIAQATGTKYSLHESWEAERILEKFSFYDQADPTNGFVTYVNQSYAEDSGLVKVTDSGSLYMGVDYETVLTADGPGRDSVRIESNEYYDQGLYVLDIAHMPGSICGTWPAFWAVGPNWPDDGEIDIIEGVNKHDSNEIVLHTSGSCDVGGGHEMLGDMTSSECGDASGTIGCVVKGQQGSSGDPFNKQNGGVYAMEWQKEYLKIWFFPRSSIPDSLTSNKPDTSEFGTPMAHLQGSCNFEERFTHQKFILDTTFCGDWAGGVFGDSGCPLSDASSPIQSCKNFVAENPAKFKEAYWELNSFKIYQLGGSSEVQGTQSAATTKTSTKTTEAATETATETAVSTQASATATGTVETLAITTSIHTAVHTETVSSETDAATTAAPSAASEVDATNTQPVSRTKSKSKSTSFVTVTTTICPASSLHTANAAEPSSEPAAEPTSVAPVTTEPVAPAPQSTETAAVPAEPETTSEPCTTETLLTTETILSTHAPASTPTSVDAVGQPATETPAPANPQPEPSNSSIPPDSVIYTAPEETSSVESWEIVSSSSAFVSVPSASPSSFEPTETVPSGVDSTSSPTTPVGPVFTGLSNKLSVSSGASALVGAAALLVLV